jgi:adenosylmethionine-8-amino-7-oxononanoate aminotransferase
MPTAAGGDGIEIIDAEGKRYIDASGGAAVSCLGHSNEAVRKAIHAQVDKLAFAHTSFFTNEPMEELADYLVAQAGGDLDRVYFVSGGSEAVETALKMARQYFVEIGQPQRKHFIARRQSYHGNTLGALSTGGNMWRRQQFEPVLLPVTAHIAPCHAWRWKEDGESDEAYGLRTANELEETILRLGEDSVAAFVAEPVVGATMGAVPAVEGYFRRVREICDKYGVLLILDEVMCGMGRTGSLFAFHQEAIQPDLLAVAKGLGAGYQPIGATMVRRHIFDAFAKGSGFFQHGHTYMGHALACAASLAVQHEIRDRDLLANVKDMGERLDAMLHDRFGNHPNVGDIRGRGLFRGVELVADRATKAPLDPAQNINGRLKSEAMKRGLMCYPGGGTIDGKSGDHILLAPPFIVDESDLGRIVERLGGAMDAVLPV